MISDLLVIPIVIDAINCWGVIDKSGLTSSIGTLEIFGKASF